MILTYTPTLSEQQIYANGMELASIMGLDRDEQGEKINSYLPDEKLQVHTFDDPVLITDYFRIMSIEDTTKRDTLMALFASPTKITKYDGISLEFTQHRFPGVWGPSIDTLLFCKALRTENFQQVRTAIELGCGSGFISKYVLSKAPNLEQMTLVDINEKAIACAQENIKDIRAHFVCGNAQEYIRGRKYDLIICNPPYIPRPESIETNAYEGIGLLTYLIENASALLRPDGRLYTNYSSLGAKLITPRLKRSKLSWQCLESKDVPLKVFNVLNDKTWMKYLQDQHGLSKRQLGWQGYDYWHKLTIVRMQGDNGKLQNADEKAWGVAA